jgi:hypothetical protein
MENTPDPLEAIQPAGAELNGLNFRRKFAIQLIKSSESRAMRIAAAVVIGFVFASEFTIMIGPVDLLTQGPMAIFGLIVAIGFALNKSWAGKPFAFVCGYSAVNYSIMPVIFAVYGEPWDHWHPSFLFSLSCFSIWGWMWTCFYIYSAGTRVKTLLKAIVGVTIVYAFQFLVLTPKEALRGLPGAAHVLADDAKTSVTYWNYNVNFLTTELGIEYFESELLLRQAPTFRFLLTISERKQEELVGHTLSKEEAFQFLKIASFWGELHDVWRESGELPRPTIDKRSAAVENFTRNYLYRTFYWVEANKLIKQGSLSKEEIDTRAKQAADKQLQAILSRTSKEIW